MQHSNMEKLVLRTNKIVASWPLSIIKANFCLNSCPNPISFTVKWLSVARKVKQMLKQLCGWMLPSLGFGLQKPWPNFKPYNRDCLEAGVWQS